MNAAQKRKRREDGRYDPKLMEKLRAEISAHPNPMFGRMIAEGRMSDSDVLDFSLNVASAYFSGDLLEPVAAAAGRELERYITRAILTTLGAFGLTATVSEDGLFTPKLARSPDNPEVQLDSVQRLVDTGLSVKEAVASIRELPAPGELPDRIEAQVSQPEIVH